MRSSPARHVHATLPGLLLLLNLAPGVLPIARASTGDGTPGDTNIVYVGRWDRSVANIARSSWSGTYFRVNFTGTSVKLRLAAATNFSVTVDENSPKFYTNAGGTVDVTPPGLVSGTHTLRVSAFSEHDTLQFQGLVLDSGSTTQTPEARAHRIEFIGDSITAGFHLPNWATDDYAWLSGGTLNAEHTQIAYSGVCLQDNYACPWGGNIGMSRQYFKLQTVDYPSSPAWDFSQYQPDAVVINLGTNDANVNVPASTFQSTYTTFLQQVRKNNPNAYLFALRAFGGDKYMAAPTAAAVNALVGGDPKLYYVDTTGWVSPGAPDFQGDGVHPSVDGNKKLTNLLAPLISKAAGWEKPVSDNFNDGDYNGWTTYGGAWSVQNGRLSVTADPGAKAIASGSVFSDPTCDADISVGGSDPSNAGLLFRTSQMAVGTDSYQGYFAGISASAVYLGRVDLVPGATPYHKWVALGTASLSPSNASRHVRVVAVGPSLNVYVDDLVTPKLSVTDATYVTGAVGVRTFNAAATFDNVSVSAPSRFESSIRGSFVRHQNGRGRIDNAILPAQDAEFRQVPGLADSSSVSFQSVAFPNSYLRHRNGEVYVEPDDGGSTYRSDATWHKVPGLADSTRTSFQTFQFPNSYLRHRNGLLYAEPLSTSLDRSDATFSEK